MNPSFEFRAVTALAVIIIFPWPTAYTLSRLKRYPPTSFRSLIAGVCLTACIILAVGVSIRDLYGALSGVPAIVSVTPEEQTVLSATDSELSVTFAAPVVFSSLAVHTNPPTTLTVTGTGYVANRLPFGRTVRIRMSRSFPPGARVMIHLANIEGPFTIGYGGERLLTYSSRPLPTVVSVSPPDSATDVLPDAAFSIAVSSPIQSSGIWDAVVDPPHPVTVTRTGDTTLSVRPDEPFRQGTAYAVRVRQIPVILDTGHGAVLEHLTPIPAAAFSFTTVKPALVSSFSPTEQAQRPDTGITVDFDTPMAATDPADMLVISPEASGTAMWENGNRTLRFSPVRLSYDTVYTVTLRKGIRSEKGGMLEDDLTYRFRTVGNVRIASASPSASMSDVPLSSPIAVTFDQDVDRRDAQSRFSVSPALEGKFSWDGRTMTFRPSKPMSFSTSYTVRLASGVKSIYGLDLARDYSHTFSTVAEEHTLDVPYVRQQENFTCNLAAASMLLSYRGVSVPEQQLKTEIGSTGTRGTGNPYKTHVPQYGTYWDAVSRGVAAHRPTRIIRDWNLTAMLTEITHGNPFMIWGQNGWSDPHEISWTAGDGTYIYAVNGMHSYVVRGFRGTVDNPTHIYVNDPWRGQYAMTTAEFMSHARFFRVAMIVD